MRSLILVATVISLASCGGVSVSESFTKEINDVEMAWKTAHTSYSAVVDSVQTAYNVFLGTDSTLKLPDSLSNKVSSTQARQLDSVKTICKSNGAKFESIMKTGVDEKAQLDKENNEFTAWKNKVLNSEIDIETAKKDLESYKTKLTTVSEKTEELTAKLNEVRTACNRSKGEFMSIAAKVAAGEDEEVSQK